MSDYLLYKDVYYYDVPSCDYSILRGLGNIGSNYYYIKDKRNIGIGYTQKNNSSLVPVLNSIRDASMEEHMYDNEIILLEKDGFIATEFFKYKNTSLSIYISEKIKLLVFHPEKPGVYLYIDKNGRANIKGISNPPLYKHFFNTFSNINIYSKKELCRQIEKTREYVLKCDNPEYFLLKSKKKEKVALQYKDKIMEIHGSSASIINPNSIDREGFWVTYLWPFFRSILLSTI